MSTGLSQTAIIDFDSQVKTAYQARAQLRKHVRVKSGITGGSAKFTVSGRGMARIRIPQTDVVPMGVKYAPVTVNLQDWHAAEYTDVFDQQKTNIEERPIVAENIAGAIGRREDQMIIDAMIAAKGAADVGAGGSGMTWTKFLALNTLFAQRSVPKGERKMVISAQAEADLLQDTKFLSSDYVGGRAVQTGQLPQILGFDIEVLDDREEGGLPTVAAKTRANFAWDKRCVGLAVGIDSRVNVDWIAEKTSWLACQNYSAGAGVIDVSGVLRFDTVEP